MTTVRLSGPAIHGVGPAHVAALVAGLPTDVRLGRIRPAARPPCLHLENYFRPSAMAAAPPESINRRDKAAVSIARMYLNNRYGNCVIASKLHALGVWSANDAPGQVVLASDQEAYSQYVGICGPGDRGCVITNVLDVMRARGLQAGGKLYKIDGYVACNWRDQLQTRVAQYLFGATTIGINLPEEWTRQAVWDVTNTPIVGGHDVAPIDYDPDGVYVASWGRIYRITWRAWQALTWLEEYYAMLAGLWYGSDNMAPCAIDVATLRDDLAKLGGGQTPPLPDPVPPIPPPPPPAGTVEVTVTLPAQPAAGHYRLVKDA